MRRLAAPILALATVLVAPYAYGLDPGASDASQLTEAETEEIRQTLQNARAAYDAGRFLESSVLYAEAYSILAEPAYIYAYARALEKAERPDEALEHYRLFVNVASASERRAKAKARIEYLERITAESRKATLRVDTDPTDAEVLLGTEETVMGRTPLELELSPGSHRIALRKDGFEPRFELVELQPGDGRALEIELSALPAAVEPRKLPIAWLVSTLATAGVATGLGVGSRVADQQLYWNVSRGEAERNLWIVNGLAGAFWGTAALTGVFGAITFVKWRTSGGREVDASLSPRGVSISATLR